MSGAGGQKAYRFASGSQWHAGLLQGAMPRAAGGPEPFLPFGAAQRLQGGRPGRALAVAADGMVLWQDGSGGVVWLPAGAGEGTAPCVLPSGAGAIGRGTRLVAGRRRLWSARRGRRFVSCHALPTLQALRDVPLDGRVLDIAADVGDGVLALVARRGGHALARFDAEGRLRDTRELPCKACPILVAAVADTVVLLEADRKRLRWFAGRQPGPMLELAELLPSFHARALTADRAGRFLLAGRARDRSGRRARWLLVLGANGGLLEQHPLSTSVGALRGISGDRGTAWIAAGNGLWRLAAGGPGATRGVEGVFLTPALHSPLGQESGWLRADVTADLPPGATITARLASTDDEARAAELRAQHADPALPPAMRLRKVSGMLDWSEPVVLGAGRDVPPDVEEAEEEPPPARLALPLHGVRKPWLWIELRFTGSPGLPPPRLHKLSIHYPERSLMQHLPAIYRVGDRRLGQLRGLVALLETGTQALDARIDALGRLIDPATVPPDWLDFLGSWLGLPWEAALPEEAKRAVLRSAGALLAARGTRAGIARLVRCLLPRRPVRLLDPATDLAPALLGTACLPAVVLGAARDRPRLGSNAVIGRACLPKSVAPGARDLLEPLSGWVRVELSATEAERAALEPVMERLLAGFVPAGIRVVLRWQLWPSSGIGRRIGEDLRLLAAAPAVLGRGAGLGSVTVAAEEPSRLPAGGIATGFRLT